jgi:hypothetical protein
VLSILVKSFEETLDSTPPPTRYLTVISLSGAKPYSCVKNGVALLYPLNKVEIPGINPKPILSGFGKIVVSAVLDKPAPNSSCNVPSERKRDT